jgi:hypothetical protein
MVRPGNVGSLHRKSVVPQSLDRICQVQGRNDGRPQALTEHVCGRRPNGEQPPASPPGPPKSGFRPPFPQVTNCIMSERSRRSSKTRGGRRGSCIACRTSCCLNLGNFNSERDISRRRSPSRNAMRTCIRESIPPSANHRVTLRPVVRPFSSSAPVEANTIELRVVLDFISKQNQSIASPQ